MPLMEATSKEAIEQLQRAKSYLRRDHLDRALEAVCDGLKLVGSVKVFGKDKMVMVSHVNEFMIALGKRSDVKQYYYAKKVFTTDHFKYAFGREEKLWTMLDDLAQGMGLKKGEAEARKKQESAREIKDNLKTGLELIEAGEYPKGKAMLRRVAEAKPGHKEIPIKIADAFVAHGLLIEALDICELILEHQPKCAKAYSIAVKAYQDQGDYEKAEAVYLKALTNFGVHPRTNLNMAAMYLKWRKWSEAYDRAKQALDADPSLDEAKRIMDQAGKRIFK